MFEVESPKCKDFQRCEVASKWNKLWLGRQIIAGFSPLGYGVIIGFNWNSKRHEWSMGQVIYV